MRRIRAGASFAALILLVSGCYQWRPVELGAAPLDGVRLTLESSELRLDSARIVGDSVVGLRGGGRRVIAADSVLRYEQRDFDWVTSAGVGVLLVMGWICIYPGC